MSCDLCYWFITPQRAAAFHLSHFQSWHPWNLLTCKCFIQPLDDYQTRFMSRWLWMQNCFGLVGLQMDEQLSKHSDVWCHYCKVGASEPDLCMGVKFLLLLLWRNVLLNADLSSDTSNLSYCSLVLPRLTQLCLLNCFQL